MKNEKPKYSVGDVLKPILDDTGLIKLHVVEVRTQQCPAMTIQYSYHCRVHTQEYHKAPASMTKSLFDFNEIEVEK